MSRWLITLNALYLCHHGPEFLSFWVRPSTLKNVSFKNNLKNNQRYMRTRAGIGFPNLGAQWAGVEPICMGSFQDESQINMSNYDMLLRGYVVVYFQKDGERDKVYRDEHTYRLWRESSGVSTSTRQTYSPRQWKMCLPHVPRCKLLKNSRNSIIRIFRHVHKIQTGMFRIV